MNFTETGRGEIDKLFRQSLGDNRIGMKIFHKFFVVGFDFLIGRFGAAVQHFVEFIKILEIDRFYIFKLLMADLKNISDGFKGGFLGRVEFAVRRGDLEKQVQKG